MPHRTVPVRFLLAEEVPGEHHQLAREGGDRDVVSALALDAMVRGGERGRHPGERLRGLDGEPARGAPSLLGDRPEVALATRLTDPGISRRCRIRQSVTKLRTTLE